MVRRPLAFEPVFGLGVRHRHDPRIVDQHIDWELVAICDFRSCAYRGLRCEVELEQRGWNRIGRPNNGFSCLKCRQRTACQHHVGRVVMGNAEGDLSAQGALGHACDKDYEDYKCQLWKEAAVRIRASTCLPIDVT